ncbi:MAG: STAS domain-containing protein [Spirochaetota bacterium]
MEALKIVTAPNHVTVQTAQSLSESIKAAFVQAEQVLLNLSRLERIDAGFVHVLYAAKRMALRDGKDFHLSGTVAPGVCAALITGGFCSSPEEDARELERRLIDFASDQDGSHE